MWLIFFLSQQVFWESANCRLKDVCTTQNWARQPGCWRENHWWVNEICYKPSGMRCLVQRCPREIKTTVRGWEGPYPVILAVPPRRAPWGQCSWEALGQFCQLFLSSQGPPLHRPLGLLPAAVARHSPHVTTWEPHQGENLSLLKGMPFSPLLGFEIQNSFWRAVVFRAIQSLNADLE